MQITHSFILHKFRNVIAAALFLNNSLVFLQSSWFGFRFVPLFPVLFFLFQVYFFHHFSDFGVVFHSRFRVFLEQVFNIL